MSVSNFKNTFHSDKVCEEYLIKRKKEQGTFCCPYCNHNKIYTLNTPNKYIMFKCASCKKRFSTLTGTLFEKSHVPLKKWFLAIFLFTSAKKDISSIELSRKLSITQKSAWFVLQKLNEAPNDGELQLFAELKMHKTPILKALVRNYTQVSTYPFLEFPMVR